MEIANRCDDGPLPWINGDLNSKPLQQTPVSENASETGYGGYGHISEIKLCSASVRFREESGRPEAGAKTAKPARCLHWRQTPRKVLKTEQPDGALQQFYPTRAVDDGDIGKRGRSRFTSGNANSDEPDANDA